MQIEIPNQLNDVVVWISFQMTRMKPSTNGNEMRIGNKYTWKMRIETNRIDAISNRIGLDLIASDQIC